MPDPLSIPVVSLANLKADYARVLAESLVAWTGSTRDLCKSVVTHTMGYAHSGLPAFPRDVLDGHWEFPPDVGELDDMLRAAYEPVLRAMQTYRLTPGERAAYTEAHGWSSVPWTPEVFALALDPPGDGYRRYAVFSGTRYVGLLGMGG